MSTIDTASPFLHYSSRVSAEWRNIEVIGGEKAARKGVIGNAFFHPILKILIMDSCKKQNMISDSFKAISSKNVTSNPCIKNSII